MTSGPDQGLSDVALVRAAQLGSTQAIEDLVERLQCVPRMLCAQNARLGCALGEHDLADAVQDTMVIVLGKLSEFQGHGVLEAWVHQICAYEFMNAVRRRRRRMPFLPEDVQPVDEAAATEWRRMLARETLEASLSRLGGSEAEVMRLRHFEGLDFEEIALRLGSTAAAVKARYYRAFGRFEEIVTARQREENAKDNAKEEGA